MRDRSPILPLLVLALTAIASGSASPSTMSGASSTGAGGQTHSDFNADGVADLAVGVPFEDIASFVDTGSANVLYGTLAGLSSAGNQFWDQTGTGSATNATDDAFGFSSASGDFDGDGFADLAVGTPGETVGAFGFAGAVSILYGSASGLAAAGSQQWNEDSANVEGSAAEGDFFGWSVASGNFNGDGFDDLVIGVPGESVSGKGFAGSVNVLYGSASGLSAAGDQRWHQNSSGVNDSVQFADQFGLSVGTGDFDGKGYADLAVGVPTEDLDGDVDAGAVNVLYGSASGLTSTNDDFWHQDSTGINNTAEDDDWFGYRATGGDFDGDGFDDLLTGAPEEDLDTGANAGGASVIYGSASGLTSTGDDFWHQGSDGINNEPELNDEFGFTVAAGNFDGDGFDDAAIGVASEGLSGAPFGGGVEVIYGTSGGLDDPNDDFWHQGSPGIEDEPEDFDGFGFAVMAGNFGNGPEDDLAVGVPFEIIGAADAAGAVNVIYGSPSDLTSTGDQFWHQDSTAILDQAEEGDWFGWGLGQWGGGAGPGQGTLARSPATHFFG